MSLAAWPLALADEACLAPLRERPDGSDPGPCPACCMWAGAVLLRAGSRFRKPLAELRAAHDGAVPVAGVPA